jgi:hypothetical protein
VTIAYFLRVLIEHFAVATAALNEPDDGSAGLWQRQKPMAIGALRRA